MAKRDMVNEMWKEDFHDKFMHYYENVRVSDAVIADLCNVNRSTVRRWKTGECLPTLDKLFYLTRIFHCRYEDLVGFWPRDDHDVEEVLMNHEYINY